jgi:hypothetical protein
MRYSKFENLETVIWSWKGISSSDMEHLGDPSLHSKPRKIGFCAFSPPLNSGKLRGGFRNRHRAMRAQSLRLASSSKESRSRRDDVEDVDAGPEW